MRSPMLPLIVPIACVGCTPNSEDASFGPADPSAATTWSSADGGTSTGSQEESGPPEPGETSADGDDGSSGEAEGDSSSGTSGSASSGDGPTPPGEPSDGIWISAPEVMTLPVEGPAWEALHADAMADPGTPNLSDQDQDNNVRVFARALVCTRLEDEAMCDSVRQQVMAVIETENGGRTLALGRELLAYVVSADLVGLSEEDDATFSTWLADVLHEDLDGKTLVSTHEDRPNNWGTHAGASRLAAAIYLGDDAQVEAAAAVFQGWLGARDVYAEFEYGELDWQSDPASPVGINPAGASLDGHDVDGVLPDDQRRGGAFTWPPPHENYVYEALQGALAQAVVLHRRGYDVWNWEDQALRRAFTWLHDEAGYEAASDDTWQPFLVNHYYGESFPAPVPSSPGKNIGYTDWTHGTP